MHICMCGFALWTSAGALHWRKTYWISRFCTFILTITRLVQKNCTPALSSLLKFLEMSGDWFQNNVFTECRCPWQIWSDLLIQNFTSSIWAVFPHFPTDCTWTASTVGLRTRMLLVCGHARTWSGTMLLQSLEPAAVPGCCSGWVPETKLDKLALN